MKYQPLLKRNPKIDERAEQVKLNVNLRGLLIHLHSRFLYTVSVLEVYDMLFLIRFSWSVDITIKYWHLYIYLFSGTSDLLQSIQPILKILYSYIAVLAKWYLNRNWYRSISYILWIISHFENKSFFCHNYTSFSNVSRWKFQQENENENHNVFKWYVTTCIYNIQSI